MNCVAHCHAVEYRHMPPCSLPCARKSGVGLCVAVALFLMQACAAHQPLPAPPAVPVPTPVSSAARGLLLMAPDALAQPPVSVALPPPTVSSPSTEGLPPLPPGATAPPVPVGPPSWQDDGAADSLTAAIGQSLTFYRTLPPGTVIPVGPFVYTAGEMARSLELFLKLRLTTPDPQAFAQQIRDKFLIFESVAEQGDNLFTGYYEPRIRGSLTATAEFAAPLYARPQDLVEVSLEDFGKDLPKRKVVGRVQDGRLVPYYSREEIAEGGVLEGRAQPIAYVNAVDLFFLQIQGSGQVELPDGRVLTVGYDASNGQPYRALGAEMIRRNLMAREDISLFSLKQYLADHKDIVPMLLNTNPSYVFFRTLDDSQGPLGNLQVPLTPGRSLAADRVLIPPGVLAYVETTTPVPNQPGAFQQLSRFMLVQDTGGAIRGNGRGDLFWGTGSDAEWIAGHAKQPGRMFILVARKDALPPPDGAPKPTAQPPQPKVLGRPLQARMP
jgi:membrane-bound lytic murein transglycosylase A